MKKSVMTKKIEIRVTESQYNKLKIKARRSHGGNVSAFVRELIFGVIYNIFKRKKDE